MGFRPPIIVDRRPGRQMSLWDEPRPDVEMKELRKLWPVVLCLTQTPLPYPLGDDVLEFNEGIVRHSYYDYSRSRDVVYISEPTVKEWKKFWKICIACSVWTWEKEYADIRVLDGSMWSLELSDGVRSITISGQNDQPRTFRRFVRAAYALAGSPVKE